MMRANCAMLLILGTSVTFAAPVTYRIDPSHTYPSFEADHQGGVSLWRGKFNKSSGQIVLDREAQSGSIEVTIDMNSIDFGHDAMNERAKADDLFDVANHPTATYQGSFAKFDKGVPAEVQGKLTMRGVTKPVTLKVERFLCKMSPILKKEVCGADASATINRADYGVSYGQKTGFFMDVKLEIAVEGVRVD